MADPAFSVRSAASAEEVKPLWWTQMKELGWNRAELDHQTHWISSGGTYFALFHATRSPNTPVGIILPIVYPNDTGWVGFFIVQADYRGGGGGALLFQAAAEHFKKRGVTVVGLDGVLQQVKTYERRGYVERGRIKLLNRQPLAEVPLPELDADEGRELTGAGEQLVELSTVPSGRLVARDLALCGLDRRALWSPDALFSRPDAWGLAVTSGAELRSWILVRSCQHGYRVGPLYAATRAHAKLLLHAAMARIRTLEPGSETKQLTCEAWAGNPGAVSLFEELGWEYGGVDYARMWLGGRVPEPQRKGGKAEREVYAMFDASEG